MITRLASAFIALPVVLTLIGVGGWWYGGLIVAVGVISLHEFFAMTQPHDVPAQWGLTVCGVTLLMLVLVGGFDAGGSRALMAMSGVLMAVLIYFLFRTGDIHTVAQRLAFALLGLLWAGGLLAVTAALRLFPAGAGWLVLACGLAWGSDSGAYFAGRAFGRHKLYEKVSPNKTWEGAIGGVISATFIAFAVRAILPVDIPVLDLFILAPIGAALGQVGDLAESLLKRSVGVKDSGSIMPGHGGLFDRLDALLFTGPTVFAYLAGWRGLHLEYLPAL